MPSVAGLSACTDASETKARKYWCWIVSDHVGAGAVDGRSIHLPSHQTLHIFHRSRMISPKSTSYPRPCAGNPWQISRNQEKYQECWVQAGWFANLLGWLGRVGTPDTPTYERPHPHGNHGKSNTIDCRASHAEWWCNTSSHMIPLSFQPMVVGTRTPAAIWMVTLRLFCHPNGYWWRIHPLDISCLNPKTMWSNNDINNPPSVYPLVL